MVSISAPSKSSFDEDITVTVNGLKPTQKVTIIVQTSRKKVDFMSFAKFDADDNGRIDVSQNKALPGGTYEGVEPMGLFWSMAMTGEIKAPLKLVSGYDLDSLMYTIQVHDGHLSSMEEILSAIDVLVEIAIERQFVPDGVTRFPVNHGRMRGVLFLPPGKGPFPAVIDIVGGANGLVAYQGGLFARQGFACLCVAYQAYEDLPKEMKVVESDYFNECYDFLANHPSIDKDGIGIFSDCQGGTIALALARCQPAIAAVVAVTVQPFAMGAESFDLRIGEKGPDGRPAVVKIPAVQLYEKLIEKENGTCDLRPMIQGSAPSGDWRVHSVDFGKVRAPVLFFFGSDDKILDANWILPIIQEQLDKDGKTNAEIVVYEDAGHTIRPPQFPVTTRYFIPCHKADVLFGGVPVAHARAQVDMWQRTFDFFRQHLVNKSSSLPTDFSDLHITSEVFYNN